MNDKPCHNCNCYHKTGENCIIQTANYYVVSTDRFMSNWGYSENRDNVCVVPCDYYDEALKVENYVKSRGDQMRIRINTTKPRPRSHWLISNLQAWKQHI